MRDTEIYETMRELERWGKFYELAHVTSFRGFRNAKDGESQEVLVDIYDAGPNAGDLRYACMAHTVDAEGEELQATGNPAGTIQEMLSTLHWHNLDG